MERCPLCSERTAKRYCPAKHEHICAVCCGTKREVEIFCPGDCSYLRTGRNYEAEKRIPDPDLAAKAYRFSDQFLSRFSPFLDAISAVVVSERNESEWLVDNDVIEAYKALTTTMKTLSSGIYYESVPEGHIRQSLFGELKIVFDEWMQPQEGVERTALKVSEAIDVLEFMTLTAQLNSSTRPKTRRYLDWLHSMAIPEAHPEESSRLILP